MRTLRQFLEEREREEGIKPPRPQVDRVGIGQPRIGIGVPQPPKVWTPQRNVVAGQQPISDVQLPPLPKTQPQPRITPTPLADFRFRDDTEISQDIGIGDRPVFSRIRRESPTEGMNAVSRFVARTGVVMADIATEGLDFFTDLALKNIDLVIPGMALFTRLTPQGRKRRQEWVDFLTDLEGRGILLDDKLKAGVDKLQKLPFMQASEDWLNASTKEKLTTRLGETILELGPSVLGSMAMFAINLPAATMAMVGSTANTVKDEAIRHGVNRDKAEILALVTGLLVGALERIVPSRIFGGSMKIKNKFVGGLARRLGSTAFMEAGTEATQETIQMAAESTFREVGFNEAQSRLAMSSFGGFMGGSGMQMIASYVNNVQKRAVEDDLEPDIDAPRYRIQEDRDYLPERIMERAKGQESVSRQFIERLPKLADLKKSERNIINRAIERTPGQDILLEDFIDIVRDEADRATPIGLFKTGKDDGRVYAATEDEGRAIFETLFTKEEVDFMTRGRIRTPEGLPAYGKYYNALVEVVKKKGMVVVDDIYHEAFHAYADLFMPTAQKQQVAARIRGLHEGTERYDNMIRTMKREILAQRPEMSDAVATRKAEKMVSEEYLAEMFVDYVKTRNAPSGVIERTLRRIYDRIREWIGQEDIIQRTFEDVIARRRPKEGEVVRRQPQEAYARRPRERVEEYQIGITAIKGIEEFRNEFSKQNALVDEAIALESQGKISQAKQKYGQSLTIGKRVLEENMREISNDFSVEKSFGRFFGETEPTLYTKVKLDTRNIDSHVAKISGIAYGLFKQKSVIISKNLKGKVDYGIIDRGRGLSYEPTADIIFNRKITLKDNKLLDELFTKHGIAGATIKADGSGIEIINLSKFNKDYEGFKKQTEALAKEIQQRGLLKRFKGGSKEVRHIGISRRDALTTYRRIHDDFLSVRKKEEKVVAREKDTRPAGLAEDILARAEAAGLDIDITKTTLAQYTPIEIKQQTDRINKLIKEDPKRAREMALGERRLAGGIKGAMLIKMMEDYAQEKGDARLIKELMASPLVAEVSQAAQTLRMIKERNEYSPIRIIKDIEKTMKKANEKLRGGTKKEIEKRKMRAELDKKIAKEKDKISERDFVQFIKDIECL